MTFWVFLVSNGSLFSVHPFNGFMLVNHTFESGFDFEFEFEFRLFLFLCYSKQWIKDGISMLLKAAMNRVPCIVYSKNINWNVTIRFHTKWSFMLTMTGSRRRINSIMNVLRSQIQNHSFVNLMSFFTLCPGWWLSQWWCEYYMYLCGTGSTRDACFLFNVPCTLEKDGNVLDQKKMIVVTISYRSQC